MAKEVCTIQLKQDFVLDVKGIKHHVDFFLTDDGKLGMTIANGPFEDDDSKTLDAFFDFGDFDPKKRVYGG